jgi:6-pyruvoyltetrahydropterin/6-carboxytetrahydropterin synthase
MDRELTTTIKVTKIFTFEMAHALLGYDGDCRNIHGHSYQLHITVQGKPLQQPGHPKDGMVIDFKQLKEIAKKEVILPYDHALVLNERTSPEMIASLKKTNQKLLLKPFQPTCENLLLEFVRKIQPALPEEVGLFGMKLYETASSYSEWESMN